MKSMRDPWRTWTASSLHALFPVFRVMKKIVLVAHAPALETAPMAVKKYTGPQIIPSAPILEPRLLRARRGGR